MGCGASAAVSTQNQNGTQSNGDVQNTKIPIHVTNNHMKGDYSQFQLAKYHREKLQKERQQKLYTAADELSGKVLEERERLSLGTRSRATSRNTSRTTSPTNNKRHVHIKEEINNPMTPVIEDKSRAESYRSDTSLNRSTKGAITPAPAKEHKKKLKSKHKNKTHKGDKSKSKSKKNKKGKKSKTKKQISFESDEHDSGLEDSAHNNENSDGVHSIEGINDDSRDKDDERNEHDGENENVNGDHTKSEESKIPVEGSNESNVNDGGEIVKQDKTDNIEINESGKNSDIDGSIQPVASNENLDHAREHDDAITYENPLQTNDAVNQNIERSSIGDDEEGSTVHNSQDNAPSGNENMEQENSETVELVPGVNRDDSEPVLESQSSKTLYTSGVTDFSDQRETTTSQPEVREVLTTTE